MIGLATGLMNLESLVSVDTAAGSIGGAITDAITGWYGMVILIFLVFAMAYIMQESGAGSVIGKGRAQIR